MRLPSLEAPDLAEGRILGNQPSLNDPNTNRCRTYRTLAVALKQHVALFGWLLRHCSLPPGGMTSRSNNRSPRFRPANFERVMMRISLTPTRPVYKKIAPPALVFASFLGIYSAPINTSDAAPFDDGLSDSVIATVEPASTPRASVATTARPPMPDMATRERSALSDLRSTDVTAPSPVTSSTSGLDPDDSTMASQGATLIPIVGHDVDARGIEDQCIDSYLWTLYQRTPKQDSVTVRSQRKVTIKKKGRSASVIRTFSKSVNENFSWKDPKAAERSGRSLADYVIGGMEAAFKARLANLLRAAELAGYSPGITSAFRDDYRQSIASGTKAANNRSYHGGSLRGGYGHGIAADVVSVNGETRSQRIESTQLFWKWIDAHGIEFGVGRPYLDRDAPHVGPMDGKEYADHRPAPPSRESSSSVRLGAKENTTSVNFASKDTKL